MITKRSDLANYNLAMKLSPFYISIVSNIPMKSHWFHFHLTNHNFKEKSSSFKEH